ncbi:hypothetical protein JCM10212_001042 [Sporobolomyces blumeae]
MTTSKRPLTSTQSTASSQSSPAARPPPKKRARRAGPPRVDEPLSNALQPPTATTTTQARGQDTNETGKLALPEPKKRTRHAGRLRRLASARPEPSRHPLAPSDAPLAHSLSRPKSTLNGSRIGGKSKDVKDGIDVEDLWVHKQKNGKGIGFAGWLKRGVGAFVDRGCTCLRIHGMAATIPLATTLALAIRDAIPGGSPIEDDDESGLESQDSEEDGEIAEDVTDEKGEAKVKGKRPARRRRRKAKEGIVKMRIVTGTTTVGDEITPDDDDADMIYQTRSKSTVEITLSLEPELAKLVGIGKSIQRRQAGGSTRGGKRSGAPRGGGARGRGRGK